MDIFRYLLDNRDSIANIPEHPVPVVYAIFAKNRDCLPNIDLPPSGPVYIGRSCDLEQRNHFKAKHSGFHSPRRSIGAILKNHPNLTAIPRSPGSSKTNYKSFRFNERGEILLVQWMQSNLEYSIYRFGGSVDELETQLIRKNKAPLNLTKWSNPQKQKIQVLRNACREVAKLVWRERCHS